MAGVDVGSGSALEQLAGQFQDLVRSMVNGGANLEIESVLEYARVAIPGADEVSISMVTGDSTPETVSATGDLAVTADALQYELGEGPCVATLEQSDQVWVDDLGVDKQFPRFSPRAAQLGVGSMLSTRLYLSQRNRAGLNLYATSAGAFEPDHLALAAIFASYSSLLLLNGMHQDTLMRMERTLESNREIGVAMGILMAQRQRSQSDAFDLLVKASQNLNRRLRDIAAEVTETRRLPGERGRARR